ncbi:ABC transporter substrate-binding protein [Oenococcus sicerae]|uniref:Extracellular solute-binding protein n=1 Tax=Oenococcus sicerae TaxID=2203724 RepID=A0AAJ1VNW6_9LACO|nr:extracellular solute-binding protein [Oenococcus sicerae]MDN6900234.1 extracellular solute-binding protein [Oenococcus sicerae]
MKKIFKIIVALAGVVILAAVTISMFITSGPNTSGKTVIQLFSTKTENAATYKELIKKFEKANPTIKVQLSSPSNAATVLKTDLAKNTLPDVMAVGGDTTFTSLQSSEGLRNLANESYAKKTLPAYRKMITSLYSQKGLYAVPYATNASGIIYNKDLFKKAGISTTPKTWNELIADAKLLKSKGIVPFESAYKDTWTTMAVWNQITSNSIPSSWITKRLKNQTTFAASHQQVMSKFLEITSYSQSDYMGTSYNQANIDFAKGKVAMIVNGNYEIPAFTPLNSKINSDMFMMPISNNPADNKVTSGVDVAFAIAKVSTHVSADNKLVAFLMENKNAEIYNKEQFSFSAVKGVKQTSPLVAGIADQVNKGNVINYPDHYYPASLDMTQVLTQAGLNAANHMALNTNIAKSLKHADSLFNAANVQEK